MTAISIQQPQRVPFRPLRLQRALSLVAAVAMLLTVVAVPAQIVEDSPVGAILPDAVTEFVFAGDADACGGWWSPCITLPNPPSPWSNGFYTSVGSSAAKGFGAGYLAGQAGRIALDTVTGGRLGGLGDAIGGTTSVTLGTAGAVTGGIAGGVDYIWDSIWG